MKILKDWTLSQKWCHGVMLLPALSTSEEWKYVPTPVHCTSLVWNSICSFSSICKPVKNGLLNNKHTLLLSSEYLASNYSSINLLNITITLRNLANIAHVYYVRTFPGVCHCVRLLASYVYFFSKIYSLYYYDVCMLNLSNR